MQERREKEEEEEGRRKEREKRKKSSPPAYVSMCALRREEKGERRGHTGVPPLKLLLARENFQREREREKESKWTDRRVRRGGDARAV